MSCCCNNRPRVRLQRTLLFSAQVAWNDLGRCSGGAQRLVQWFFYRNNSLVWSSLPGLPQAVLAIGTGSTHLNVNADTGQITAFLLAQGVAIQSGDTLCIVVRVKNCRGRYALSNRLCFSAALNPAPLCGCAFRTAFTEGQTGPLPAVPAGFETGGGFLVFSNGLFNAAGNDLSATPPEAGDRIGWVGLSEQCPLSFILETRENQIGPVAVPPAFSALAQTDYLVFRNGAAQRTFALQAGNLIPEGTESEATDHWAFLRLSTGSCQLRRITITASGTGSVFQLPAPYSAAGTSQWLLFVNDLLQYPGWNYEVFGNTITLQQATGSDSVWIAAIT